MKISFLGDSITYAKDLNRNEAWISIIQEKRKDDLFINKGISGDTSSGMLARLHPEIICEKPDFVHIMGGLNDIICHANADQIKGNFKAMSKQANFYGIKPIIGISPLLEQKGNDFERILKEMRKLHEWLYEFSSTSLDVMLIDYDQHLSSDRQDLYLDNLHLNKKGNEILADIFLDFLQKLG